MESGAHFQVKTEDRHTLLTILDCSKVDSGHYMVTADNSLGSDFSTINVQVRIQFITRSDRKSQVRQCLGFCTADIWTLLAFESAKQKPKLETSHQLCS